MGAIKALLPPQNLRLVVKRKTIARCSIASCGFYEQVSLGDLPSRYGAWQTVAGDSTVGGG